MPATTRKDDRLWGGRFDAAPNAHFDAFQRSFAFDQRLLPYEIAVDRAWAKALAPIGIFTDYEVQLTLQALERIEKRATSDPAWLETFGAHAEDVHHFVEMALVEELGPLGWKLHTGRSRNELVATDFRLFLRDAAKQTENALTAVVRALLAQAKTHFGVPMAGMTHMQHAQPILLSHFLLAQAESLLRDIPRLHSAARSADSCPMGSGALAGNSFHINREAIARDLGFSKVTANSLDAVSDRDFALDYLFALSGIAAHLSRIAEDYILFASQEFAYLLLSDEFSTGSSLMPQKKNPDSWELIRGKSGRITAALFALLTTLKGLPTSYQRDLQEDKESLFAAHDQINAMLAVAAGAISTASFHVERLKEVASNPVLLATEAADYLVRKGVPFRQAHDIVGKLLRTAEQAGKPWTNLPLAELQQLSPSFGADFAESLSVAAALAAKKVSGGTAPDSVRAAIASLEERLRQAGATS
jgi:argininosuccinate lyase